MVSFKLAEYLVYPEHNKLELNGVQVKVEPKIMEILCFLIQHRGQVISREYIATNLWPNSVVGLDVVTRAIFELRKVLNDSAQNPIFIETIAKKGYCFIYDINNKNNIKTHKKTKIKKNTLYAILTTMILLTLVFWQKNLLITDIKGNEKYHSTAITQPDTYSKMPNFGLSKKILLVQSSSSEDKLNQVVLIDSATNKRTEITKKDANYLYPKWASNGEELLYLKCKREKCKIIKHNIKTGLMHTVLLKDNYIMSYDISKSNKIIAINYLHEGTNTIEVVTIDDNSSNKTLIIPKDKNENHSLPKFSYNDEYLFFVSNIKTRNPHLKKYNMKELSTHRVNKNFYSILDIEPHGKNELLISGKKDGQFSIWSLNLNKNTLLQNPSNPLGEFQSDLSSSNFDASTIVYKNWKRNIIIGHSDLGGKIEVSNSNAIDINSIYSRELQTFYFVSNRSGAFEIWSSHHGETQQITLEKANSLGQPLLSTDLKKLAFLNKSNILEQLIILNLKPESSNYKYDFPKNSYLLNWSSNGENIIYSYISDGQYTLSSFNIKSNQHTKIAMNAGMYAKEQTKNNDLIYVNMSSGHLMSQNKYAEAKSIVNLFELNAETFPRGLMLTSDWLYYVVKYEKNSQVMRYNLNTKKVEFFYQLPKNSVVTQIGGDGHPFIIYDHLIEDNAQIILLEQSQQNNTQLNKDK
ncbi:transcriptional regulatory protein-like protein [Shewanella denitrificans OS217]|uniref:Transcriptional regulatory protein-like protein n=1 Tax=Shewanella denitrificans (strain OS217 / ATCC BAA-1090 / DSM 15013) TaxID=318161 RepID=Q12IY1_SHEDO|nr:winged helix-turn-helix domain-containing protein [Shewanella denitrificans]ABE56595.1 transcriptional regulatory protein-like protein [Shewanella denitrificans OS217]